MTITQLTSAQTVFMTNHFDVLDPMTGATSKDFSVFENTSAIFIVGDHSDPMVNAINAQFLKLIENKKVCLVVEGAPRCATTKEGIERFATYPDVPIRMFRASEEEYYPINLEAFTRYDNRMWKLRQAQKSTAELVRSNLAAYSALLNNLSAQGHLTVADNRLCPDSEGCRAIYAHRDGVDSKRMRAALGKLQMQMDRMYDYRKNILDRQAPTNYFNPEGSDGGELRFECMPEMLNIILIKEEHLLGNDKFRRELEIHGISLKVLAHSVSTKNSLDNLPFIEFATLRFNEDCFLEPDVIPIDCIDLFAEIILNKAEIHSWILIESPEDFMRLANQKIQSKCSEIVTIRIPCKSYETVAFYRLEEYRSMINFKTLNEGDPSYFDPPSCIKDFFRAWEYKHYKILDYARNENDRIFIETVNRLLFPDDLCLARIRHIGDLSSEFIVRNHRWEFQISFEGSMSFQVNE